MHSAIDFPITRGTLTAGEIRSLVGREDPVIVEIGANSGQTTVEMLKVMPGATIYAFEPDPRAIAKFRNAIRNHPQVHLFECAIGAVNGNVAFFQSSGVEHVEEYSEGWDQSGSIRRPNVHLQMYPWVRFDKQITVPITTMDKWYEEHPLGRVDFVWADVQGAESDLIQGAGQFLQLVRYLYTEYSNEECYAGQVTLGQLADMLKDFELAIRYPQDALFKRRAI